MCQANRRSILFYFIDQFGIDEYCFRYDKTHNNFVKFHESVVRITKKNVYLMNVL